jgi:hypothetical protein
MIYEENGGIEEDRLVNVGYGYIVDLKFMIRYMINDPGFDIVPVQDPSKVVTDPIKDEPTTN